MSPFRLAWPHNVQISRSYMKGVDVEVGLFPLFTPSSMSGTFVIHNFILFS
jgi:hypothetical protein